MPGVDALFLGPGDLSATMGHVGELGAPGDVFALMQPGRAALQGQLGKPVGTVGGNPARGATLPRGRL